MKYLLDIINKQNDKLTIKTARREDGLAPYKELLRAPMWLLETEGKEVPDFNH